MKIVGGILLWIAIIFLYFSLSYTFMIALKPALTEVTSNALAARVFSAQLSAILSLICVCVPYRLFMYKGILPSWCISNNIKHYGVAILGTSLIFSVYFSIMRIFDINEIWVSDLVAGDSLTLTLVFITILVLAPISEEITMRWWGIYILRKIYFPAFLAVLVTSAAFAAMHTQYSKPTIAYLFILGCWFGFLRLSSNSISVPILAHMLAGFLGSLTVFI